MLETSAVYKMLRTIPLTLAIVSPHDEGKPRLVDHVPAEELHGDRKDGTDSGCAPYFAMATRAIYGISNFGLEYVRLYGAIKLTLQLVVFALTALYRMPPSWQRTSPVPYVAMVLVASRGLVY